MASNEADIHEVEVMAGNGEAAPESSESELVLARDLLPGYLPVVPLHHRPLFPKMTVPMVVDDESLSRMLVGVAKSERKYVGLILVRERNEEGGDRRVTSNELHKVGVVAELLQVAQVNENAFHVLLGILERFRVVRFTQETPHIVAQVSYMIETDLTVNQELKAYSRAVVASIKELIQLNPLHKEELSLFASQSSLNDPGRLADFSAVLTTAGPEELQDVLETNSIRDRLRKVLALLKKEIDISKIQVRINKQIEEKLSKQQREFFLREQLKAIKKELGLAKDGKDAEVERLQSRLAELKLTPEASDRVREEIDKLKMLEPASPEFNVTRSYLDWLTALPWGVYTEDSYDIKKAEGMLDEDHYGLRDVKDRILEFLAVGITKGNISGSILCFVGPPGVGKTSIGRSIARSIGRNFYRFSLGGMRDEAEIKGHRRTYIGALPGKFIQSIKTCGSANPVIMLDEIDKIGASFQGDPASALLEVLDPEQNRDFLDHYLDVRFDLSNVFFICTANQLDTIPKPLLDRMEVIKLAGYILQEKLEIAKRFLIPKQLKAHGVKPSQVRITARALREMIDGYAREPGVRGLENHIKQVIRKTVKKLVEGERGPVRIDIDAVRDLLGRRQFTDDVLFKVPTPGVVMGLAWTSLGGDTLHVEATAVKTGKPGFKQTGQLGDVMVESSEIAYTYVRSFLDARESVRRFFSDHYVHLHVPAGATRKDGPSAGITMATALVSLVLGIPVRKGLAMTGELSLTGNVMAIGGLKEKTIAAKRAKARHLIFPEDNRKDFEELPAHIRKGLTPHFVSTFAEVVSVSFPKRRIVQNLS